ncbi:hypothetical protein LTR84_007176 [Exophiala bonariae]|uniref:Alpha-galactosidase n=1 Tax=Exophiala bonariae TaxID=1690606 RepID=A0AAV9MYU8_9EURO|nr:hypothetical protein LTR84_007176 [Exophiala bonariae]
MKTKNLWSLLGACAALANAQLVTPAVLTSDGGPDWTDANGLARTPPMGWSSWNQFGDQINEQLIRETIDALESTGLRDAGYRFVNLDDGWQAHRGKRSNHPLEYDSVKFPNGIKAVVDYAHSKGFKMGIYSGPGEKTCAGYTGSIDHEQEDAEMFASWGIDHLKYDACCSHQNASIPAVQKVFRTMSEALLNSSRPIVYHTCHCGWADIWQWAASVGANHWRIGQDIPDDFNYPGNREKYYFDVLDMIDRGNELTAYSAPGHFNDFDMLIVGLNGKSQELVGTGCSNVEYRTHFSLWSILSSPLLIGADVRNLDSDSLKTLLNKDVIALNQDVAGNQAALVQDVGNVQVYAKELNDSSWGIALLNRGSETADITFSPRRDLIITWDRYFLRDLWKSEGNESDFTLYNIPFTTEVMPHEAKVYRISQPPEDVSPPDIE